MTRRMLPLSFVIDGTVTKKNSSQIVMAGRRRMIIPSRPHRMWFGAALLQAKTVRQLAMQEGYEMPIRWPVNVADIVYRKRATGDLINYLQALADLLESAGIVADDKLITSWDGSRLDKDAKRPRHEVKIEALAEMGVLAR